MSDPTFTAVKRHLYRQSLVIFASATVAVLLGIAVMMAVLEVLAHERANLKADFTATMAYIHEQEHFLRKLQVQNEQTPFLAAYSSSTASVIPVSLLKTNESPVWQSIYPEFASHLAQYYALFWSFSDFPAAHLLVLEQNDAIRLTVPTLKMFALSPQADNQVEMMDAALLEQAIAAAQHYFANEKEVGPNNQILWLPLPNQEQRMLALLPAGLPASVWSSVDKPADTAPPRLWLAMVLNHQRLQAQIDAPMLEKHQFSLHTAEGKQVLGAADTFVPAKEGFRFALVMRVLSALIGGCYCW